MAEGGWFFYCAIGIGWTAWSLGRAWRRRPWRVAQLQAMGFGPFAAAVLVGDFGWPVVLLSVLAQTALARLAARAMEWLGLMVRPGRSLRTGLVRSEERGSTVEEP